MKAARQLTKKMIAADKSPKAIYKALIKAGAHPCVARECANEQIRQLKSLRRLTLREQRRGPVIAMRRWRGRRPRRQLLHPTKGWRPI